MNELEVLQDILIVSNAISAKLEGLEKWLHLIVWALFAFFSCFIAWQLFKWLGKSVRRFFKF